MFVPAEGRVKFIGALKCLGSTHSANVHAMRHVQESRSVTCSLSVKTGTLAIRSLLLLSCMVTITCHLESRAFVPLR
ncbi:hypothetical protein ACU8KH_02402 [Lachancea thermotolerans]